MKTKYSIPSLSSVKIWALGALLLVAGAQCQAQLLLASWSMDEGTGTTLNDSSGNDIDLTLSGSTIKWSSDGQGLGGSGYALWAAMTSSSFSAKAINSSTGTTFDNLVSYTITGWINTSESQNGMLFSIDLDDGRIQFVISGDTLIVNRLLSGDQNKVVSSSTTLLSDGSWTFIAITVDSTASSLAEGITFYVGTESVSTTALSIGSTTGSISSMALSDASTVTIANGSSGGTALVDTYLSDFSVYGSTSDSSGALSASAVESIRAASIPESSSTAMLMGLVVLLGVLRFKQQRTK